MEAAATQNACKAGQYVSLEMTISGTSDNHSDCVGIPLFDPHKPGTHLLKQVVCMSV